MKFKRMNESLFEGKKISFVPVFADDKGYLVDEHGMPAGARLSTGKKLRNEMDPFANGGQDGKQIDPNHYIPKAEWDGIDVGDTPEDSGVEKTKDPNTLPGKVKLKTKKKGKGPGSEEEIWKNMPIRHVDDETGEEYIYQICIAPQTSPNMGKGRWVTFDEAIF